jgi:hypothetical protein
VLADNALLSSFAIGERPVTRQTVLDVCRDFDLGDGADELDVIPQESVDPAPAAPTDPVAEPSRRLLLLSPPPVAAQNEAGTAPADDVPQAEAGAVKKRRLFSFSLR